MCVRAFVNECVKSSQSKCILLLLCVLPPALLLSVGAIDDSLLLMMFWILTGLSVLGLFSQRYGLQPLTIALIIRSIYHFGLGNTLILLGSLNVRPIVPACSYFLTTPQLLPVKLFVNLLLRS